MASLLEQWRGSVTPVHILLVALLPAAIVERRNVYFASAIPADYGAAVQRERLYPPVSLVRNGEDYGDDGEIVAKIEESYNLRRYKRDFMFASGRNETDPECFKSCNAEWKRDFQRAFDMPAHGFYDFPFHPKILNYANFIRYCELAERQAQCFIQRCEDESADRVFSPANFLCHFKRQQFVKARPCLEDTEPMTFLKCDQECHQRAVGEMNAELVVASAGRAPDPGFGPMLVRAEVGRVFSGRARGEMENYERELGLLCTFQECYKKCHQPIISALCSPILADLATDLINLYIQWHAADIYDWHLLTDNVDKLPASCVRLTRAIDSAAGNSGGNVAGGASDTGLVGGGSGGMGDATASDEQQQPQRTMTDAEAAEKVAVAGGLAELVIEDPILKAISAGR